MMLAHKHEDKICPRCQSVFECRVGDITNCQCYPVKLNEAERDFLAQHYADCLCASCIKAIPAEALKHTEPHRK